MPAKRAEPPRFIRPQLTLLAEGPPRRRRLGARAYTAKFVEKYGADASVQAIQEDITRDCPGKREPK